MIERLTWQSHWYDYFRRTIRLSWYQVGVTKSEALQKQLTAHLTAQADSQQKVISRYGYFYFTAL